VKHFGHEVHKGIHNGHDVTFNGNGRYDENVIRIKLQFFVLPGALRDFMVKNTQYTKKNSEDLEMLLPSD